MYGWHAKRRQPASSPYGASECSPVQQRVHHPFCSYVLFQGRLKVYSTCQASNDIEPSTVPAPRRFSPPRRVFLLCSSHEHFYGLFPRPFRHCPSHQSPAPFRRIPRRMPPDCPIAPAAFMLHKSRSKTQLFTGRTTDSTFPLVIATQEMTLGFGSDEGIFTRAPPWPSHLHRTAVQVITCTTDL